MTATDPNAKHYYVGPVHGGEGKEKLKAQPDYQPMGVHRSAPNPKPAVEGGPNQDTKDGSEGPNFDLLAKSYAGPYRMVPNNKGEVQPDDIKR